MTYLHNNQCFFHCHLHFRGCNHPTALVSSVEQLDPKKTSHINMSKRKTARSKPPLKLPLEIHGDRSGTYGLVVVAPLWEVPRCMPLRGKIGILPSSSSSHLVKLEDLIFFFPLGLPTASWVSRCTKLRYKISICIIYILLQPLFFEMHFIFERYIHYKYEHQICKAPFSSIHQDGHWQSQASKQRTLERLLLSLPRAERVKSYQYRSNMRLKLDLHR